jgi:hypothetical protein
MIRGEEMPQKTEFWGMLQSKKKFTIQIPLPSS